MAKNQPSTKRDAGGQPSKDKGPKGGSTKSPGKAPEGGAKGKKESGGRK